MVQMVEVTHPLINKVRDNGGPGRTRTYDQVIMSHSAKSHNNLPDSGLKNPDSARCTNGCTRTRETGHDDRLEALSDAIRNLTADEQATLTRLIGGDK